MAKHINLNVIVPNDLDKTTIHLNDKGKVEVIFPPSPEPEKKEPTVYYPEKEAINVIAHRGYINQFPENTLIAMSKALDTGADELECDIQLTSDKVPVLLHDETLDRLFINIPKSKTKISQLTMEEADKLRFKSLQKGIFLDEKITKFEDFLAYARKKGVVIYPEIKTEVPINDVHIIVEAVTKAKMEELTVFQSFNMDTLRKVRELNDVVGVGYLIGAGKDTDIENAITTLAELKKGYLLIEYHNVLNTPSIVSKCKEKSVNLGVWTCNSKTEAEKLTALRVTNIMTNVDLKGLYHA